MRMAREGSGLLRQDQAGFTLPEMLMTIMIMIVVLFALYNIFDMSLRVFSFGNDKVEAVENARLAMERMEREIRSAAPQDKAGGDGRVILSTVSSPSHTEISFGNDLNKDRKVQANEVITYSQNGSALQRGLGANPSGAETLAEPLRADGLKFYYLKGDGTPASSEGQVGIVRLEIAVDVRGRVQNLQTDVALRNRGV